MTGGGEKEGVRSDSLAMASPGNAQQHYGGCRDTGMRNKQCETEGKAAGRALGKHSNTAGWQVWSCEGRALSHEKVRTLRALCTRGVCRSGDAASTSLMSHGPPRTLTPHISALPAQTSQSGVVVGLQTCYFFLCFYAQEPKEAQDVVNTC